MIARVLACWALVASLFAPPLAAAQEPQASLPDIEDEVMCPICGTTLELSEAPQAERERELIRELIAQGRTKDEIKDVLVAEYGEDVIAVPDGDGFDLTAWLVPPLAILALAAGLFVVIRRSQTRPFPPASHRPGPEEGRRLDEDLDRYDL